MSILFVYHKTYEKGAFWHTYYVTRRQRASIGDSLFVISGDSNREPNYFLEGRYLIKEIESTDDGRSKLLLAEELRGTNPLPFQDQPWFDKQEFKRLFVSGQSMNPVQPEYVTRFNEMLRASAKKSIDLKLHDAIDDIGSDAPSRSTAVAIRYARDPRVRKGVLLRAKGKCEFCGKLGFTSENGERYLEAHHIIALAADGEDRMTNVIALCPDHHREAHYGAQASELEKKMIEIVRIVAKGD